MTTPETMTADEVRTEVEKIVSHRIGFISDEAAANWVRRLDAAARRLGDKDLQQRVEKLTREDL